MSLLFHIATVIGVVFAAVSSAVAADAVKVASIYAFSGVAASSNSPSARGVRYGVEEVNRRGGILGQPVELIELDNLSTPIGSKVAADRAVTAGVAAIIGASWSSHSLAIAKVAQAHGLPMITTDSTNERVTRIGDYVFRVCYTDPFQGKVMARFAATELKAASAAIMINSTSDYSIELAEVFARSFTAEGGTIRKQVHYKHSQDHFRSEMEALRMADSDVLFVPGHDESAAILLEAVHAGIRSIPIGCDGWSTINFFERGGERVPVGYYCTHWSEDVGTAQSRRFVETFKRNGRMLSIEPLGYDAVLLLADAASRAKSLQPARLRAALAATEGFPGVTGDISFDRHGDPIKATVVMQIRNGVAVYLKRILPESPPVKPGSTN
jgi:branched-chain amino acid transport system substrate-binding protein